MFPMPFKQQQQQQFSYPSASSSSQQPPQQSQHYGFFHNNNQHQQQFYDDNHPNEQFFIGGISNASNQPQQPYQPQPQHQILTYPNNNNNNFVHPTTTSSWSASLSESGHSSSAGHYQHDHLQPQPHLTTTTTTNINTSTSSLFDGVKQFFTGILTPEIPFSSTSRNHGHDEDDEDDSSSEEDPERDIEELYGLTKKKRSQEVRRPSHNVTHHHDLGHASEAVEGMTFGNSKIISTTGRGQLLSPNKDFDLSKCSKLAVKLRYEKTVVEKQMEMEREWMMWNSTRKPTSQEEETMYDKLKTREKFHDDHDYGFYDDLANETPTTTTVKEKSETSKISKTKEQIIEVDVPFTMYAIGYTSFGAPLCISSSDQKNGPKTIHSMASIPKHEKILKKKSLKLEEISQFESFRFLDTRTQNSGVATTSSTVMNESDTALDSGDANDTGANALLSVQEEIVTLNLKKPKAFAPNKNNSGDSSSSSILLHDERFHYVIFFVEFVMPETILKERIQKSKGDTTIVKHVPFCNRMQLSILDISYGEDNARELCRFYTNVNNTKNYFGKQIVGGIHFKTKERIWKFRSSNEFKPIPPRKLIVKLESVEDIPFLSDVYISLWFTDRKFKTKVIKSKNPKFNETFEYDISCVASEAETCYSVMFEPVRILLKEKKAFQKENKRLIGEVSLPPLPHIFSGNNYVFAFSFPPLASNTSEEERSDRKKGPILCFSSEYGLQNQGTMTSARAKVALFLAW